MIFTLPNNDSKLQIPSTLIHGTTTLGVLSIYNKGIQSRGYNISGVQNPPASLDFGEGFYCSLDNDICRKQVHLRAQTKATSFEIPGVEAKVIEIHISPKINKDSTLKCIYFDGDIKKDGLEWAEFIAFHRVFKDKNLCTVKPCIDHPDIIFGPVADGNAISKYAHDAYNNRISIEDFYSIITKSEWFPNYKQYVFHNNAIKYLQPVLKL